MSAAEVSRRAFLTALGAGMGGAAWAKAPTVSLIPEPRPRAWPAPGDPPRPRDIVAEIALPGQTGYVVADAVTGEVLAAHAPDRTMSTASVAKFVTAQYALETFGPAHRFTTRILATSPIAGGRVDGDVILAGGADPMLDSDDLAAMVQTLAASGLKVISGRLLVHRGPVPLVRRIDASQPDHVSYNPGVSGLSLNFNRVYFEWKRDGDGYATRMDARGAAVQPQVGLTRMAVVDRASPVFAYQSRSGFEDWSVARGALGKDGARWLPVRNPALYAGHALAGLLAGAGITVAGGVPRVVDNLPATVELARHDSMTLDRIVRSMLYYSTNLIAEVIGMASSAARGGSPRNLTGSAALMNRWVAERFATQSAVFADHSGLGETSRASPAALVKILVGIGPESVVGQQMRKHAMPKEGADVLVRAKTGTLNFVSGLAGFAETGGRVLAFAILASDMAARRAIAPDDRERPRGAKGWANRARYQEGQLLLDWARRFK